MKEVGDQLQLVGSRMHHTVTASAQKIRNQMKAKARNAWPAKVNVCALCNLENPFVDLGQIPAKYNANYVECSGFGCWYHAMCQLQARGRICMRSLSLISR